MVFKRLHVHKSSKNLRIYLPLFFAAGFSLNCFSSEKSLPGTTGQGQVVGKVVGSDGTAIVGAQVTTSYKGVTMTTTSSSPKGDFSFSIPDVERGQGFNVQFSKTSFDNASQAAVITLPNLKVDMGNVVMYVSGGTDVVTRTITGQIIDNFSYKPLIAANVTTVDAAGQVLVVLTDDMGKFTLSSNYFPMNSSFAVSAYKNNYITRTDLVSAITAEQNPIKNNPIRLYQKFGAIYGYMTEDSLGTALNGVSAVLTDSNNQQITCTSGGPYDSPEPLAAGLYCPDMDDDYSTTAFGLNGGGFKFKDQFLLLGNRYSVTLSKTSTNCTNRVAATTNCYRTKTTYADVQLTGNNAISGANVALYWDAWIHGTVSAGSGVTVKLYDSSNTYLTSTTTDATGAFLLDTTQIARAQQYKLTFEKSGYYARLIGLSAPYDPILITIANAGANNTGAVTMTALPPPTHCVSGTVNDYWSTAAVSGATVEICQLVTPGDTTVDANCSASWSGTTNSLGQFNISGNFPITTVDAYMVKLSKTGYTGSRIVSKHTFKFTHSGVAQAGCAPFNLDSAPPDPATPPGGAACGATGVGPAGGTNCVNDLVLYPVGVFAVINGSMKQFKSQIKQTYERFLTDKIGLTISGRTGDLPLTQAHPTASEQVEGIYLHLDDTPRSLPAVPDGKWSNHVPVNPVTVGNVIGGTPVYCTPTSTSGCSPRANGVLTESIGTDTRIIPWDIKTYVFYNFYAAAPGSYTIYTEGSTDTKIQLIAQTGANLGSDDDSGTGSNAKIGPISLLRGWYYVKVTAKDDNTFGFFDLRVDGPVQAESNYATMISAPGPSYQTTSGTATYQTTCAPGNGNLVVSWYDANGHVLYIAAPGENGGCSANATVEKHGPIGDIVRGRFDGVLRPISASGANATITNSGTFRGFYNIIRME